MRADFARAHPRVAEIMAPISRLPANESITEPNRQLDVEDREPADVARDRMVTQRFVTEE